MSAFKYAGGGSTDRGPSPGIWAYFDVIDYIRDPTKGVFFHDDFLNFGGLLTTTAGDWSGYRGYQDTSATILPIAEEYGVVRVSTHTGGNSEASMSSGNNAGTIAAITAGMKEKFAFECRVRLDVITTNGFFVGLAEEASAAADLLADTTVAMADKDLLGFHGDDGAVAAMYRTNGSAAVNLLSPAHTMVAATWVKLGFRYDPSNDTLDTLVDGAVVSSDVVTALTNFPTGEELALLIGIKETGSADRNLDIDWWRVAKGL